jgi:hypothetical protein
MSAPYTGGFSPGSRQFAVDGNFYSCDPCSPPKITFPMKGDSVFSNADVIYLSGGLYTAIPFGLYPNIQPWSANQRTFVIEQDFMVAMEAYQPLPLNTPYDWNWSIGWQSRLTNGNFIPELFYAVMVEEDPTEDMGQGIIKVRRRFATCPPTRNEVEQFTYTFPGLENGRITFTKTVQSRIQYDYFVFDDFGIYPYGAAFPAGNVLNASTGLYPANLILTEQRYYAPVAGAVTQNYFLPQDSIVLSTDSVPSINNWYSWMAGSLTSNGVIPEIIAEPSTMRRWMGNIWERRTRYVQVI